MEITLKFIDSAYADDPAGYDKFFARLQEMLNRMAMSHAKYQQNAVPPTMEAATAPIDEVNSLLKRLSMYDGRPQILLAVCDGDDCMPSPSGWLHDPNCFLGSGRAVNTGNAENLLDVANMAVIESIFPKHPKAHFRSQESKDSPGLSYLP